ncbi:hypothetical protein ACHWQZ_G003018 [Mnemiopsis leidyi]
MRLSTNEVIRFLVIFATVCSTDVYIRVDTACLDRSSIIQDLDGLSCSEKIMPRTVECIELTDHPEPHNNLTCDFNLDPKSKDHIGGNPEKFLDFDKIDFNTITWSCSLSHKSEICDGVSQCLTDECHCSGNDTELFFCADGLGCISWDRLCDGKQDCMDGSDECFCTGVGIFHSEEIEGRLCMPEYEEDYCGFGMVWYTNFTAKEGRCDDHGYGPAQEHSVDMNPIETCLMEVFHEFYYIFYNSPTRLVEYCQTNCSYVENFDDGWIRYCDHIVKGYLIDFEFQCDVQQTSFERYHVSKICDGVFDCTNQLDEHACPLPERFYCNPNETAEWVNTDKVCDKVKDCANGFDECGMCQFEVLSSSKFLIQSKIVLALATIMGFLIIGLNFKEELNCWLMTCSSKIKAIDRVFLLQIFFYDILMGAYMCFIVLAAVVLKLKGDYCVIAEEWRASVFCSSLGVLFSFSSHGSLLAIASVSIIRFLTCHNLLFEIKKRTVIIGSILITGLNLFHSVLPLLSLNQIKDGFRTALFLSNINLNPFFDSNPINISRLKYIYEGMLHKPSDTDVHTMVSELAILTNKSGVYDFFEIGYYGNTGLCVHNIFKDEDFQKSYKLYKILYCSALIVLLLIVSAAYIMIVCKQKRSFRETNPLRANQGSAANALTLKVALVIGSQLVCWIPFIMTVFYFQYVTSEPPSKLVFESFALVIIPINSFLNPLFYGERYKKVESVLRRKWRQIVSSLKPEPTYPDCGLELEEKVESPRTPDNPET